MPNSLMKGGFKNMKMVANRQKCFLLLALALSGLFLFCACSGTDYSGYYGDISREGIVLSVELKQDGSMQTNVFGLPLVGTYSVAGDKLTLTYEYLGMKDSITARISKDRIEFADITLERDFSPSSAKPGNSQFYGGLSDEGFFLSLELMRDGSMQTNLPGININGAYTIDGQQLKLKYNFQNKPVTVRGRITENVVSFENVTLIRDYVPGKNEDALREVLVMDRELSKINSFTIDPYTTDAVRLYAGGGRAWWSPKNILIVPSQIEYKGKKYSTVLKSRGSDGAWDIVKNSDAHTLLIADGVEIWKLYGYYNSNLRVVCLPDDVDGKPTCTLEESGLEMLAEEYPDLMYYVVEGSSAHECCEQLHLPYAFRPGYEESGLHITQKLAEDDPSVLAYLERLEESVPQSTATTLPIKAVPLDTLKQATAIYPYIDGYRWGYLDENGNVSIPACYDYAGECEDGLCIVAKDGLYGIISSSGEEIVPLQFQSIEKGYNGIFGADAGGKVAVLNVPEGIGHYIDVSSIRPFYRDHAVIYKGRKAGVVDKNGMITIEPEFDTVQIHQRNRVVVSNYMENGGKGALYKTDGSIVAELDEGWSWNYCLDGSVIVCEKGSLAEGNLLTKAYYASGTVTSTENEMILQSGSIGYWTTDGKYYSYDDAKEAGLKDGEDGHWYQIDFYYPSSSDGLITIGNVTHSGGIVKNVRYLKNGVAILEAENGIKFPLLPFNAQRYDYYNAALWMQQNSKIRFLRVLPASDDGVVLAEILRNDDNRAVNGFAWLDIQNPLAEEEWTLFIPSVDELNPLSNPNYDEIVCMSSFQNGYACIYNRQQKAGLVNQQGEIVLKPSFDLILRYPNFVVGINASSLATGPWSYQNTRDHMQEGWCGIADFPKEEVLCGTSEIIPIEKLTGNTDK